ncbi:MAG TPA: MFS transporter [Anaerolineae bacterium]|nr:MFS transporter [Anaerolineae bacterium]HQH38713.1 MFS transporter [Anaerolineae bacterium]
MQEQHVRRNVLALVGDFVFFSIGFAFYDPVVIVPAFVKEFTGSSLLIGALAALRILMITVPQIWAASFLVAQPRKKPLLVWSTFGGRFPVLFLALATLWWTRSHVGLTMTVLTLSVAIFYTSEGLNGVTWPALVGKVIPDKIRGRFFGAGQLLSSLGAAVAGIVVSRVLDKDGAALPERWALLFGCGFVGLMLSLVSMLFIREEAEDKVPGRTDVRHGLRMMLQYLRTDASLRRVVITQMVIGTAGAAFPFFIVRARETFVGNDAIIGTLLTTQSIGGATAALLCGYIIDRVGSWASIRLGVVAQTAALLAVILAGVSGTPEVCYFAAFFLLGFVTASSWWSFSAYLLDIATDEQRPIYLATSGILSSVTVLNPLIVGALFEALMPATVFVLMAALSACGGALAWRLRKGRKEGERVRK